MDDLLTHAKQFSNNIELEFILIDSSNNRDYKKLLEILNRNCKLISEKQTINFISEEGHIKQFIFEKGIKNDNLTHGYVKKRLKTHIVRFEQDTWKLKLSTEIPSQTPGFITYKLIRFKRRFSYIIDNTWQIDYTFTKQCQYCVPAHKIKEYKEQLFLSSIYELFDQNTKIEIEIEFLGDISSITNKNIYIPLIKFSNLSKSICDPVAYLKEALNKNIDSKHRRLSIKQLLPFATQLTKKIYANEILRNINNFCATQKIDGERVIFIKNKSMCGYLTTKKWTDAPNEIPPIILDCELYRNKFYVFDIIKIDDQLTIHKSFKERYEILQSLNLKSPFILKQFIFLKDSNFHQALMNISNTKNEVLETDGIIFNSINESYTDTKYYKWKPPNKSSIDFLVKKCPKNLLGIDPYVKPAKKFLYLLYVGIRPEMADAFRLKKMHGYSSIFGETRTDYYPIHFTPSINPMAYLYISDNPDLDNKIIEMTYKDEWIFMKERSDRQNDYLENQYYGNDFMVAEFIYTSLYEPFTFQDLLKPLEEFNKLFYFIKNNSLDFIAIRKYNNFVKDKILNKIVIPATEIVDIGCGKGQDFLKYIHHKIKKVTFIDINFNNIYEIIERKYLYFQQKHYKKKSIEVVAIISDVHDLKTYRSMGNLIICNFAIHYMAYNDKTMTNFCKIISNITDKGSRVLITYLNGEKIFNIVYKSDFINGKYHIKKKFISNKYTGSNQKIEIKLPFSDTFYEEYLFDYKKLVQKFKKYGFELEIHGTFKEFLEKYNIEITKQDFKLSKDDLDYMDLLEYVIVKN